MWLQNAVIYYNCFFQVFSYGSTLLHISQGNQLFPTQFLLLWTKILLLTWLTEMQGFNFRGFAFETNQNVNYFHEKVATQKSLRKVVSYSVSKDSGASVGNYDVPFPSDYDQLLQQVSFFYSGIIHIWLLLLFTRV